MRYSLSQSFSTTVYPPQKYLMPCNLVQASFVYKSSVTFYNKMSRFRIKSYHKITPERSHRRPKTKSTKCCWSIYLRENRKSHALVQHGRLKVFTIFIFASKNYRPRSGDRDIKLTRCVLNLLLLRSFLCSLNHMNIYTSYHCNYNWPYYEFAFVIRLVLIRFSVQITIILLFDKV